jgi:hypothetical protein
MKNAQRHVAVLCAKAPPTLINRYQIRSNKRLPAGDTQVPRLFPNPMLMEI